MMSNVVESAIDYIQDKGIIIIRGPCFDINKEKLKRAIGLGRCCFNTDLMICTKDG